MFSSLRFRLWLTYVLVVGVVLAVAGLAVVIFLLRTPTVDRQELQRLRLVSNFLIQRRLFLNATLDIPPSERLQEAVERADRITGTRVAIFSAEGELLADSRQETGRLLPDYQSLQKRLSRELPVFRDSSNRQWLYLLTPLEGKFHLLLASPRPRLRILNILRDDFLTPFLRGAALALVLSALLSIWIANWIATPLQRLEKATHEASLERINTIPLEGPREVQSVAKAFNEMSKRLQASQRSQRDFIANVSHDLKTPLTSIQGFAQAILDGVAGEPEQVNNAARVIYHEAGRLQRMVLELLDLARFDAGTFVLEKNSLDLGALLQSVMDEVAPQAHQAQVDLRLEIETHSGALPPLIADADRLSQVFINLIDNAINFTPAGGQVLVSVRAVEGWLEARVADTGPGIPPEELERVFERFYRVDKSRSGGNRRGVGLGLAIAREIVQAHGGTIKAYNRSDLGPPDSTHDLVRSNGGGAVFVVRLPSGSTRETATDSDQRPPNSSIGQDSRLL